MKCLMPLVCLEGLFSFSEDGQPCIIDYKTLLQCYFISITQLTRNWGFIYFRFFIPDSVCIMCAPCVCVCARVCVMFAYLPPFSPSLHYNTRWEAKRQICRNNSPISTSLCTVRWQKIAQDKRQKVGRDKPTWNNGRVKCNLTVLTPTLSHLTADIWLYF